MKNKFMVILEKNPGWKELQIISDIHSGNDNTGTLEVELSPREITLFSNAPITSVDVERSFSLYKSILRPDRRQFSFQNLKFHLIISSNCTL